MSRLCDIIPINPGNRRQVYQSLGDDVAAIEPPFLVAVMAAWLRERGFRDAIIDANVLRFRDDTFHVYFANPVFLSIQCWRKSSNDMSGSTLKELPQTV